MGKVLDFLIIIPAYKRVEALRDTIQSAVNQSGVSKQVIVVDDDPAGSAKQVTDQFSEVIYIKNPEPSGGWPGRVRNYGFQFACDKGIVSDFIHFLVHDDTVPDDSYQAIKEAFSSHPSVGVVFGVLQPFFPPSDDLEKRKRQEQQLRGVRNWRIKVTRFPWLYQQIGAKLPMIGRWMFNLHAMFGWEMFLCSGGFIRYQSFIDLGGFPKADIRITQDYFFYTNAIRRLGVCFIQRVTARYGVGEDSIWNPLDLEGEEKRQRTQEWTKELKVRQTWLHAEMGSVGYYTTSTHYR